MNDLPIIRVSVEGIQQHMMSAISQAQDELKDYTLKVLQAQLAALTADNFADVITAALVQTTEQAVRECLSEAVEEAVYDFFRTGPGKDAIVEAIQKKFKVKP